MADVPYIDEGTPAAVSVDIQSRWPVLYRVPVQVRQGKKHIYEPVVVPLGPYHHLRDPQLKLVEQLKDDLQDMVLRETKGKSFLVSEIIKRMDEIRHFYGGARGYDDEELAEMMLRDACFLVRYVEAFGEPGEETYKLFEKRLGVSGFLFTVRDMVMLENQIPLWLISLIQPDRPSLCQYLSYDVFADFRMTKLPWLNGREPLHLLNGREPLHLLEALRCTYLSLVETQANSSNCLRLIEKYNQTRERNNSSRTAFQEMNNPFRSVTDLKAKGIHFRPSSNCLGDIKFFPFGFYAELHLPLIYFSDDKKVFFSNLIALEMSPEAGTNMGVTSYFNFMKTLINNAKDVKVLREKDILYSTLASDEEVVEMFKSIDTYGYLDGDNFLNVTLRIEDHCNSKARTWMADLMNTKFRSPWSVIALAAATFLLCLTFLQTYYTINPRN